MGVCKGFLYYLSYCSGHTQSHVEVVKGDIQHFDTDKSHVAEVKSDIQHFDTEITDIAPPIPPVLLSKKQINLFCFCISVTVNV